MSVSRVSCFLPWKNFIWDSSIVLVNSSEEVIVARIVSPGWIDSCWNSRIGTEEARGKRRTSKNIILCSILAGHLSKSLEGV